MGYFNGYPATYQPAYTGYQYQQQNAQAQQQGIIWVQGEAGAKSYLVAPNSTVQLWDSEDKVIYIKSADAAGMPSMKVLDYTIRGEEKEPKKQEYATKDDLEALENKVKEMLGTRKKARTIREDEDDE